MAARSDPVAVFIGAVLGLWAAAAVAVTVGAKSLKLVPMAWIQRITASILLVLGIYTVMSAITG
jgi:putative Ca2+/H+ antiporter (TMEM165/GDT1 family)